MRAPVPLADAGFDLIGAAVPNSPVVLSVPHAGREYPTALLAALRVPATALTALEDRHVDAVALAARGMETLLVQRRGRAWIDLNRGEDERDPAVEEGVRPPAMLSAKLRSGLGLVPRRTGQAGDLWRRRFTAAEVTTRIAADHRPYHLALATLLSAARARFGIAVLLDVHSMPPLGPGRPRVVIGDRFGRSASPRLVACAMAAARDAGRTCALNTPYAGGHITARHGRPNQAIHALQVEFDRSLYLDLALDRPGEGLADTAKLLRAMIDALCKEACKATALLAAE